jgi:hypothetical protein
MAERLRVYQTASPRRDFALHYSRRFDDVRDAERLLAERMSGYRARGEWMFVHPDDARVLIESL